MDNQVATDNSSKLYNAKERMKEKRHGSLKTAKQNASLASKIKNKIINNSSIIKVSLKRNNKALALALNSEKALSQKLIEDKKCLMKEMEVWMFNNARLRRTISYTNKILKELEAYTSAELLCSIRENDSLRISKDISAENCIIDGSVLKHRINSPSGSNKSSSNNLTTDMENGKQPDVSLKNLFLQQTKSPQTQYNFKSEEPSNSDGSKQVNALSNLESELADMSQDAQIEGLSYENKSPFWANVTQRKKMSSSSYLNQETITVNFEADVCSNHLSQWNTGHASCVREMNGQEASTFSWLFDAHYDSKNDTSLLEDAILYGHLTSNNQNIIPSEANKDVASPSRSGKCVFMDQEVQDTVGMHAMKNSENNSIKQSQSFTTLELVDQPSSGSAMVPSSFLTEVKILGENTTLSSSGPPEDQLYQVRNRIARHRQTYLCSKACSDRQEKLSTPPSEKRKSRFSEKQIQMKNQSPNSSPNLICKSPCERYGVQFSQKNTVADKQMFPNEINKETPQIRNRMPTDLPSTLSKTYEYKEKSMKESEKIDTDQQIPNTSSQAPQCLPCVRMVSVEMIDRPLKQEISKRSYNSKASDQREENIPLECNLKPDSQEYISNRKTKGRQAKQGKSHQKKECLPPNSHMKASNLDNRLRSTGDSLSRIKESPKSHAGNSRIPKLASCSVEPGLNNVHHTSVETMKNIQNSRNKSTIPSTVQENEIRNMSQSMIKAKQKVKNVLSDKDQPDFGSKVVSGTISGECGQVKQNEVHNGLSKAERTFSQRVTKKLVLNSPRSLEPTYVTLSPELPVRTFPSSPAAIKVLDHHLVKTASPIGLESLQITRGRTSLSDPKDTWSVAVLPRNPFLSKQIPPKENKESYNQENIMFPSLLSTSKFLKDSGGTLRRSTRNKENLVSYQEPRLNCKLRRGDPFTDTLFLYSPINRKKT